MYQAQDTYIDPEQGSSSMYEAQDTYIDPEQGSNQVQDVGQHTQLIQATAKRGQ